MNAPAPEAENEYSKGSRASGRRSGRAFGGPWPIAIVGLIGAGLLIAAEFRPLYSVHLTTFGARPTTVSTGSHDAFALVPIALLAAGLALARTRVRTLAADAALGSLGVVVLLITIIGDVPDTRARGIAHGLAFASTSAGAGLYLETLGAVLLIGAGGAGILLGGPRRPARAVPAGRRAETPVTRRASRESAS